MSPQERKKALEDKYDAEMAEVEKVECPICLAPTIKKKPYGVCCSMNCHMEFYD